MSSSRQFEVRYDPDARCMEIGPVDLETQEWMKLHEAEIGAALADLVREVHGGQFCHDPPSGMRPPPARVWTPSVVYARAKADLARAFPHESFEVST